MLLNIIIVIAIGFFALLVLTVCGVFCTPVLVSVDFNTAAKRLFYIKAAFFGGLCPMFSTSELSKPAAGKSKKHSEKKSARKRSMAQVYHMVGAAPGLAAKIIAQVKIETLNVHIAFGLPDPADTGVIYGVLAPFALLAEAPKAVDLSLHPNFGGAMFESRCHLVARFTPIALVLPALNFVWVAFVSPRLAKAFR